MFNEDGSPTATVAIFFVSYIVINGMFVLNIVIAVLLDAFVGAVSGEEDKQRQQEQVSRKVVWLRQRCNISSLL